jgi:hypothetical protein
VKGWLHRKKGTLCPPSARKFSGEHAVRPSFLSFLGLALFTLSAQATIQVVSDPIVFSEVFGDRTSVSFNSYPVGFLRVSNLQLGSVSIALTDAGSAPIFAPGTFGGFTTNCLSIAVRDDANQVVITFPPGSLAGGMMLNSVYPITVTAKSSSGELTTIDFHADTVTFLGFQSVSGIDTITVSSVPQPLYTPIVNIGDISYGSALAPSGYTPLATSRILDSRAGGQTADGLFSGVGSLAALSKLDLQVAGRAGIPGSDVSAVVVNLTATNPTANGYLTAWPSGSSLPLSSNLNFVPQQTVANLAIVPVGSNGSISLYNSAGTIDVIADVVGYFSAKSQLNSLAPQRFLDTRASGKTIDGQFAGTGPVLGGKTLGISIAGRGGVPQAGAGIAILNVTVTNPSKPGFITAFAGGADQPVASNLNFATHQTTANLVVVPIGEDGQISLYNSAGSVDLIADLIGWLPSMGRFIAVVPARIMDTRIGAFTTDGQAAGSGALQPQAGTSLSVAGRAGVPLVGAGSVILNVTATNTTKPGYITVWPGLTTRPQTSTLNFDIGNTVPNVVITKLGVDGTVALFNSAGTTDIVVDIVGWLPSSP